MKIIDLLNKIEKREMDEALFYVANGDFFYDLIVINENLYVINTTTKQLELLETKYISRFIRDNVELMRLDNFEEILEEKKIPEKLDEEWKNVFDEQAQQDCIEKVYKNINSIIDYLKSKEE